MKIVNVWSATVPYGDRTGGLVSGWSAFGDPSLTALIVAAQAENPHLGSAAADIEKSRATQASTKVSSFPGLHDSVRYWIALCTALGGSGNASIAPAKPLGKRPKGNLL